jgi:hypothetical protein
MTMSMSSIIRAVAGGPKNTRAEGETPEEDDADEFPPSDDTENAEDSTPKEDETAEDDAPTEEDAEEGDEEEPKASAAAFAAGRKAERKRIGAIMGNPAADANPQLAAHLAFATSMRSDAAVAALKASGTVGGKLAGKMAGSAQPRLGGSAQGGSGAASQPERIAAHAAAIIESKRARSSR